MEPVFEREELRGIEIGQFTITKWDEDSIWIENIDGEGMQVENETFEDAIVKFFKEHF